MKKTLTIVEYGDEEIKDIVLGDGPSYRLTHDAHGWDGMAEMVSLAMSIAAYAGLEIKEEYKDFPE